MRGMAARTVPCVIRDTTATQQGPTLVRLVTEVAGCVKIISSFCPFSISNLVK